MSPGLPFTFLFIGDENNSRSTVRRRKAMATASQVASAEIIDVPTSSTGPMASIHVAGMAYQDWLDEQYSWRMDGARLGPAAMVWDPYDLTAIDEVLGMVPLRGDEIVFPSLDSQRDKSWAAGHPRALLHWSLTLRNAAGLENTWPTHLNQPTSEHNRMVWWAQRINLRVYGAS